MVTITLFQAINARRHAFAPLLELDLPLDISFRIGAVIERIEQEVARYDKARNKRLTELGKPAADGKGFDLGANLTQFNEEVERLESAELTIDWEPIKAGELGVKAGRGLAAVFGYARWLFREESKPADKAAIATP